MHDNLLFCKVVKKSPDGDDGDNNYDERLLDVETFFPK